ncbi:hypothetical protein [Maritalea sp.]|uniref:hypothetical protein n=1 Tax=Maritalea sp. TaxID=2003361 RepID=UPI003EFAD55C
MKKLIVQLLRWLTFSAILTSTAAALECPANQSVYRFEEHDLAFEIRFVEAKNFATIASDLYLLLKTPNQIYWFNFNVSNGYSGITLHPISDPYDESARDNGPKELYVDYPDDIADEILISLRFYPMDEDLRFLHEPPLSTTPAPAFISMPEIGLSLWYNANLLTEKSDIDRDPMPRGIFRLAECSADPMMKAYP